MLYIVLIILLFPITYIVVSACQLLVAVLEASTDWEFFQGLISAGSGILILYGLTRFIIELIKLFK